MRCALAKAATVHSSGGLLGLRPGGVCAHFRMGTAQALIIKMGGWTASSGTLIANYLRADSQDVAAALSDWPERVEREPGDEP